VKQVARLHWIAAQGSPRPASWPAEYRVLLSTDGNSWTPVANPGKGGPNVEGDVTLNADARYLRLETIKINDGTGWSLGLREIWATAGRDDSEARRSLRPKLTSENGAIRLTWNAPSGMNPARYHLYHLDTPISSTRHELTSTRADGTSYTDRVPNWTPRYYYVEAVDADGKVLLQSDLAAGIARPSRTATPLETFAFWYEPYRPSTDPKPTLDRVGNAPFVIGPNFDEAAADLKSNGKGLLPYVSYYQTRVWTGYFKKDSDPRAVAAKITPIAFYRQNLHYPDSPPGFAPSVFSRPGNVEYSPGKIEYITCPNSAPFREMVLEHTRKQLDGGAVGFFVDNGYDDPVAADKGCGSRQHLHYYGEGITSAQAYLGLLLDVYCEVKKRNPNGVLMVNGGVPPQTNYCGLTLGDVCDGQLWESYLRTSYTTPNEHVQDWQSVYNHSLELEKEAHSSKPHKMFVLSYPWNREEAYYTYATAKLFNLPWSANLGENDASHARFGGHFGLYPELVGLRLGQPIRVDEYGGTKFGQVYYREYEHGLVVVNPTKDVQTVSVRLDRLHTYQDLFSKENGEGSFITVRLSPESGRVYTWR
jgi:hypothetical protein